MADAQGHGAAESVASKKTHSERRHLKAPRKELMFLNVPSQHRETTRVTQSTGFGKIRPDGHRAAASTGKPEDILFTRQLSSRSQGGQPLGAEGGRAELGVSGKVQECFRDEEVNLNEPEDVLLYDP